MFYKKKFCIWIKSILVHYIPNAADTPAAAPQEIKSLLSLSVPNKNFDENLLGIHNIPALPIPDAIAAPE